MQEETTFLSVNISASTRLNITYQRPSCGTNTMAGPWPSNVSVKLLYQMKLWNYFVISIIHMTCYNNHIPQFMWRTRFHDVVECTWLTSREWIYMTCPWELFCGFPNWSVVILSSYYKSRDDWRDNWFNTCVLRISPSASWLSILLIHIISKVKTRQSQRYKSKEFAKNSFCNFD